MTQIPLNYGFDQSPESYLGRVDFDENHKIFQLFAANPLAFTFEPGYIKHADGTVELLEISLVPRYGATEVKGDTLGETEQNYHS